MRDFNSFIGVKFSRLTVLSFFPHEKSKQRKCLFKCDCGVEKVIRFDQVARNNAGTKSCGCLNKEVLKSNHLVTGRYQYKYTYNEDFFKTLTFESAYILGYLYSDGCLGTNSNCVQITSTDKDILEKMALLIKNSDRLGVTLSKGNNSTYYHLNITNKVIYNSLLTWGLYPNKSLTLTVDQRLKFNKDFWRGMIDGDGSCILNDKNFYISICGTKSICEDFLEFCNTIIPVNIKISINSKSGLNFAIRIIGNKAKIIHQFIYENNTISMNRKSFNSDLYKSIDFLELLKPFKVKQLNLDMTLVKIWDSVKQAAIALSIRKENIQAVLGNSSHMISNNYKWEYVHKPNIKYY